MLSTWVCLCYLLPLPLYATQAARESAERGARLRSAFLRAGAGGDEPLPRCERHPHGSPARRCEQPLPCYHLTSLQIENRDVCGKDTHRITRLQSHSDLGVGPGILSIGAVLMGAAFSLGVEVDETALDTAWVNTKKLDINNVDLLQTDVQTFIPNYRKLNHPMILQLIWNRIRYRNYESSFWYWTHWKCSS